MRDIIDGIAQVRDIFMREKLKAPVVIILESHEQGVDFIGAVRQSENWSARVGSKDLGSVVELEDGSTWVEVKIMDIAVRWPTNRLAKINGNFSYE